ncbi:hypothetical protein BBJ41_24995 [Burkholderia stabilis]|nr:hypothetical protein BBJ41_24995 [Burkholderia stabilis]
MRRFSTVNSGFELDANVLVHLLAVRPDAAMFTPVRTQLDEILWTARKILCITHPDISEQSVRILDTFGCRHLPDLLI